MNRPTVSIVIPCYNQAHFLSESVDSALAQTYAEIEILVVDDGSTDNTRAVAARYGDRIRYIHQENGGLAAARNTGIRHAKGELIALLDSDDRWLPHKLETQVPHFADSEVALVHASYRLFPPPEYLEKEWIVTEGAHPTYLEEVRQNKVGVLTAVIRRSVLEEVGGFDAAYYGCEDWELWLRIAEKYRLVGCAEILAEYRLHGSSMTHTNGERMYQARKRILEKQAARHPDDVAVQQAVAEGLQLSDYQYFAATWRLAEAAHKHGQWGASLRLRLLAVRRHPRLLRGVGQRMRRATNRD